MQKITILAIFVSAASASMQWILDSNNNAAGTASVIYSKGSPTGAQFSYSKTTDALPLVSVYLHNQETGTDKLLQSDFNIATQACSCYYLDAQQLSTQFTDLKSSLQYRILFKSLDSQFQTGSGYLGIVVGSTLSSNLTHPSGSLPAPSASSSGSTDTKSSSISATPTSFPVVSVSVTVVLASRTATPIETMSSKKYKSGSGMVESSSLISSFIVGFSLLF